eukprot:CAMPEP_0183292592 /NCGR_PEP_ID=MMETSP0160_2-20130417/1593_1 /TAXON_ID=2839 ORGANISM="Odontella Sinensis, Strain Grunow 1884" /NCGR_SAMPLE_ID=MMETSP0160_2 /ASSEMBLY_ACC=CAM_ASM_000250 /LENGTH=207 /DNA_ID=CAMNT_0025453565 /DNA_START=109 /DNA_END=732 /DNA_ORIENTATION=+
MKVVGVVPLCMLCSSAPAATAYSAGPISERPISVSNFSPPTRRAFLGKSLATTGLVASSAGPAFFGGLDISEHSGSCACADCSGANRSVHSHGVGCDCGTCVGAAHSHGPGCECGTCVRFGPNAAFAYDQRDVGGAARSADTAALNIQARETNARLEASGFKMDSREVEAARLSEGLSSFSYDMNSSAGKKGPRGYSTPASSSKERK